MQRVPLFIGRWKYRFAIFFISAGDSPLLRQIGAQSPLIAPKPAEQGPVPWSDGICAERNADALRPRESSARHLIPVLEIGPHEDSQPSDSGRHRGARRGPVGRLGPAKNALRCRLWRLVREDDPG